MKYFKRSIGICLILILGMLSACSPAPLSEEGDVLHIVTTVFPAYDWVRMLTQGTDADIRLLTENGVDIHSYQPTAKDIIDISTCDLLVYVGGTSDAWVEDAQKEAVNADMKDISLIRLLGAHAKEEETVEGMEPEEEDEETAEYDEHVWLSLKNAEVICTALSESLCAIDPPHREVYQKNLAAYRNELSRLDAAYQSAVDHASVDTLLFGDRFPFRYLTDDYHLHYYAAFAGCSAETEASFETVVFLAKKADELRLPAILTLETSDGTIAETIRENTVRKDQAILTLNSMQSITQKDLDMGVTYLSVMQDNLTVFETALGSAQ